MTNKTPLVSVIMPVRNAGSFLMEAVESILSQTYKNLELIVINDASTDGSLKILASFKDKRIRIFSNKKQLGVTKSANIAIPKARGEYIARMDADDVSFPTRIAKQVAFLKKNKKVVAVGAQCELINSSGVKIGEKLFPLNDLKIRKMIFSSVPVQQPALMVAAGRLPKNFVWYDENLSSAEELELLFKLFEYGEIRNLDGFLLRYRIHKGNTSLKNPKETFYLTLKTRIKAISKYGYRPTVFGIFISAVQVVMVTLMPGRLIYPLFSLIRGMSKISINFDAKFLLQKTYQLVKE